MSEYEEPCCPACGEVLANSASDDPRTLRRQGWTYSPCAACGLRSLTPIPDDEMLETLYGSGYFSGAEHGGYADYAGDASMHLRNARKRLRLLERADSMHGGVLVDVGCAFGYVLEAAQERGWSTIGVDVSEMARTATAARLGVPVYPSLSAIPDDGTLWSVVTYFQVLEHMPDPALALRNARERLAPGGVALIETWDAGSLVARAMRSHWQQVTPPSVVHLFDRPTLRRLLNRVGFDLAWIGATSKQVSVGQVAGLISGKYPQVMGTVGRRVAESRLGRVTVPYRLGDLISLVAVAR